MLEHDFNCLKEYGVFADFAAGAGYLLKGFRLIRQPGLRRYFVAPVIVNIIVFASLIGFGVIRFAEITQKILPQGDGLWAGMAGLIVWVLFGLVVLVLGFFLFSLVVNFIGAPFNGLLSEKVERQLSPATLDTRPRKSHFFADIIPSIVGEIRKAVVFLAIAVILMVLVVIPGVNIIAAPLALFFTAWMLALEYLSYPMNNHNKGFSEVRRWLRKHRMLGLGFGVAVATAMLVPIVNLIVMPAAVAGATALWVERRDIDSVKLY